MISGIYKLIDGSIIQKHRFDAVANNIANSSTVGFKKDLIAFDQMLTMKYHSQTDFSVGPTQYTGHPFDIALADQGFFKIQTTGGVRYTRDGTFTLNGDKTLVTQTGNAVLGQNGPIKIDGRRVSILSDGQVMVDDQLVDKIAVVGSVQHHIHIPRIVRRATGAGAEAIGQRLSAGQTDQRCLASAAGIVGIGWRVVH